MDRQAARRQICCTGCMANTQEERETERERRGGGREGERDVCGSLISATHYQPICLEML